MKTILYHSPCPDGTAAALAAHMRLGDDAEYVGVNYGQPVPEIPDGSDVWILDFSYPASVLLSLARAMKRVTVLDHHATAEKDLSPEAFRALGVETATHSDGFHVVSKPGFNPMLIHFDMSKSGAVLAFEHFHPGTEVPPFFHYVQDRDLWRFELPESRDFSAGLRIYPMTIKGYEAAFTEEIQYVMCSGTIALNVINQAVDAMCKNVRCVTLAQAITNSGVFCDASIEFHVPIALDDMFHQSPGLVWSAPCANATVYFSEVGEKLLELYPHAQFSAYYFDRADGKRQWGLRSRPEFDCSVIAKAFFGGGHKCASGFTQQL